MAPISSPPSLRWSQQPLLKHLHTFLTSPRLFWPFVSLTFLGELVLGLLIIRFVPYTEIDYKAYMEQVAGFLGGERDYSKLEGGTGPLVYPALHLYIYTLLSHLPSSPPSSLSLFLSPFFSLLSPSKHPNNPHLLPQLLFLSLYLLQFLLTASVYRQSSIPQYALIPLALGKRAKSIYMLRLFGDCWAVAVLWVSVGLCMMKGKWRLGSVVFSLALGIKMNILLYLPGLLLIWWKALGPLQIIPNLAIIILVQILLPLPFFLLPLSSSPSHATQYFTSAFDLSRSFLYAWTVNWRFLPEHIFLSRRFHLALLLGQVGVLALFGWRWCRSERGGAWGVVKRGLKGMEERDSVEGRTMRKREIPAILFTSNLIGVIFARSLHYQFQSWYFHSVPLLLCLAPFPLPICLVLFGMIEYGWLTYPSTTLSSSLLLAGNVLVLVGVWCGDAEGRKGGEELPRADSQARRKLKIEKDQ